jgi:hypothetical protein
MYDPDRDKFVNRITILLVVATVIYVVLGLNEYPIF